MNVRIRERIGREPELSDGPPKLLPDAFAGGRVFASAECSFKK